jgi:acyl-CoA synthetase (NDP forming)
LICLQGLDDTLAAIAAAGKYHSSRRAVLADRESRELSAPAPQIKSVIQVDEAEGKAALESFGLTIPRGLTGSSEDVIANAETLGYPLAVKLLSADLAHKNHAGAVHLNVGSKLALEEAVDAIKTSVGAYDPTLQTDRFLIERMVASPLAEFIVGVSYKPGLGHALIIGRGGTDVEELRDFAMLLLPVSAVQIEDALRRLNLVRKLRLEQQDIASLVQVVSQVAQFSDQYRERLVELDVNPIILDTFGKCTAVDAMMRIRS